jgi:oligopeptidase B
MLVDMEIFRNYLVLIENDRGVHRLRIINWQTNEMHYIPFEEESYDVWISVNRDFETENLRFGYSSLRIPWSIYEYNMNSREQKLLKRYEILGGYDPGNYISERAWAKARDGQSIPLSIVYHKNLVKNGNNPAILYGYGAYGESEYPGFDDFNITYLDRGFVYAIAHVRGGSDLGMKWYKDGKLLNKKNSFTDFINCAEFLVEEGFTSEGMIVAQGGSAGGLLVGAAMNMKPELFRAVVLNVPFVDVINTMLDPDLPLTTQEYTEWGNPNNKEYFDYMISYSPYNNVSAGNYPHMLFTTGLTDEQVGYWEPVKMVAKLRDLKTNDNRLLIKVDLTGHRGASGRYDYYDEVAFEQAFVLTCFDIWE